MFEYPRSIGMRDVDAGGVLFFARYLSLAYEASEALFVEHDLSIKAMVENYGVVLPVIHADVDYRQPLSIGETAIIQLSVTNISRRTFTLAFNFLSKEKKAANGEIIHACVDCGTRQATALPEQIVAVLQQCS